MEAPAQMKWMGNMKDMVKKTILSFLLILEIKPKQLTGKPSYPELKDHPGALWASPNTDLGKLAAGPCSSHHGQSQPHRELTSVL